MVSYTNLVIKKSSEMYELGGVLGVQFGASNNAMQCKVG
jgi:hypothetical protein